MAENTRFPYVGLIVLDGFGVAESGDGNAIARANMPFFKNACRTFPYGNLQAAGEAVGLPWGEKGNSEVGHMNLGMGRIAYQDLPRINNAIRDGSYFQNEAFRGACDHVKQNHSRLHVIGILSNGFVHGSDEHLYQILQCAKQQGVDEVYIHAILDGRDTPPKMGIEFLNRLFQETQALGVGKLASVSGRYFAMDRDNRWDRIEKAYRAMVDGIGEKTTDVLASVLAFYDAGKMDEDMPPLVVLGSTQTPIATIGDNDAVIFCNFRNDRARQLTEALTLPSFDKFAHTQKKNLYFVTMTQYETGLPVQIAFPPIESKNVLAEVLANNNIAQLHIAETEKFAHVTNFFDGGLGTTQPKEEFILVPSPSVAHYDEEPGMSAATITEKAVQQMNTGKYQFLVINFANADMVGHTGNLDATIAGLTEIDGYIRDIVDTLLSLGGACIITGDHGNAEEMINRTTGEISKEHTSNPVPFVLIAEQYRIQAARPENFDPASVTPIGILSDVAPTILDLFQISQPTEMTGHSLLPSFVEGGNHV